VSSMAGGVNGGPTGEWRRAEIGYLKPNELRCTLCGRLLSGRYWADGSERSFCTPHHERLFHTYWLPRYGQSEPR
jgi:hypothetical protein